MRFAGIVVAAVILVGATLFRRRARLSRGEHLAWTSIALALGVVSVSPPVAGFLTDIFRLENRLFAVLVAAVLILLVLQLRSSAKVSEMERRFGALVRSLAVREAREAHAERGHRETVAIVIAAYNEEEAIEGVLRELPAEVEGYAVEPIVVVDGGTDDTEEIVRAAGYLVVTHPVNRGQGDALRTGFDVALRRGAGIVVTMDADGQHSVEDLPDLVKPVIAGEADYVQGSRFLGRYDDAGGARDLGIRLFTRLINLLSDAGITDCTNGYRAIRADRLPVLRLEEDRFSAPEIIMESAAKGLRMLEVPVHIRTRSHGESKKPRRLGYPLGFLRTIVKVWLR